MTPLFRVPLFALAFGIILVQESTANEFELSAFGTLTELSVRAEDERRLASNVLFVGAGVAAIGGIGAHIDGSYRTASLLSVTSAVALGGGVLARSYETSTERALSRVETIEDPAEREQRSRDALFQLASDQRGSRLTSGVLHAGLASYYFFLADGDSDSDTLNGVVSLAASVARFAIPGPAERAVKRLQQDNRDQAMLDNLDWQLGIAESGSPMLALGIRF
ncbi:MAG: hypothetical protein LAT62_07155 [Natronospirillum sp.]|uniref:hypothetical protein n=1 Tax=Natronospirillum sp. TaxID=2812955 RepID=UPI0025D3BCE3|nr:hypothetical protein [Natronospirillum sp.]MCH8551695.1 hypothetical protein [Natronospirillum sp.]